MTINDLTGAIKTINEVKLAADGNPKYGYSDNFETFIMKMLCLTPQSYGARLQGFMIQRFGLKASDDKDRDRKSVV